MFLKISSEVLLFRLNDRQKTIVGRSGLGLKQTKASFEVDVRRYLTDYSKSDSNRDLVFDTGYSNEERKFIHMFVTFKLICGEYFNF